MGTRSREISSKVTFIGQANGEEYSCQGKTKRIRKKHHLEVFSIYEVTSAFLVTGRKCEIGDEGTDADYRMVPRECDVSNR